MVGVVVSEVPEVLGDVETPLETFGGHKVLGHLDAVVDVSNLRKNTLSTWSKKIVPNPPGAGPQPG